MLVLCSEHEAWSLVLVEAMSCGIPCVSMDCPNGPREIIINNVTGFLTKNGDVIELSEKIEWLILHEKERKEMGAAARRSAESYKMSVVMNKWIELYTENHMK